MSPVMVNYSHDKHVCGTCGQDWTTAAAEFASAFERVERALPPDTALTLKMDGPGYRAIAVDRMGNYLESGWSVEYDEEYGYGEKGVPASWTAALLALLAKLEERK